MFHNNNGFGCDTTSINKYTKFFGNIQIGLNLKFYFKIDAIKNSSKIDPDQ